MKNTVKEFEKIKIKGAGIYELQVDPLKKLEIRLFTFGDTVGDDSGGKEYDLLFNKITDLDIEMRDSWCRVNSHAAFRDSEFLNTFKARPVEFTRKVVPENLTHFQIVLDNGQLDIIAEGFSCNLIWEV